jgi:hypothetical protein
MKRLSFLFVLFLVCTSVFAQNNGFTESDRQLILDIKTEQKDFRKEVGQLKLDTEKRLISIETKLGENDKYLTLITTLLITLIVGVFGLIGFVAYDRRTAIYPLEKKLMELEQREIILAKDHEITRKALREEALQNPVLKDILIRLGIF